MDSRGGYDARYTASWVNRRPLADVVQRRDAVLAGVLLALALIAIVAL